MVLAATLPSPEAAEGRPDYPLARVQPGGGHLGWRYGVGGEVVVELPMGRYLLLLLLAVVAAVGILCASFFPCTPPSQPAMSPWRQMADDWLATCLLTSGRTGLGNKRQVSTYGY